MHTLAGRRHPWVRVLSALLVYQLTAGSLAFALPHGAQVVGGAATLTPNGSTLQINQLTPKAIINWQGFSIGSNELVRFLQPGASAVALNRVIGAEASHILGQLTANGRVFLINPNGIIFGAGAQVNVGSLLATTLNISDADFMAGNYVFRREHGSLSSIVNHGTLRAADGGFIALSAPGVVNQGTITARLGTVHLSSAERLTLDFAGDGLVRFAVDGPIAGVPVDTSGRPLAARVSNEGRISADGGEVTLTARAVADVLTRVVNNSGVIEARSLVDRGGVVRLAASDPVGNTGRVGAPVHQGEVKNAAGAVISTGTIDVSAAEHGAARGEVTLSGAMVGVSGSILARGLDGVPGGHVLLTSSERTIGTTTSLVDTSGVGAAGAGNVVLWSDADTLFRGRILARGGDAGGDGGQLEVSGKERLEFAGFVDTRAPLGRLGTLLLDPRNITVATGGVALLPDVDQFADTPNVDLTIAQTLINSSLSNVTLQANNDITLTNAIAMTTAGAGLTLLAGRSVIVNNTISTNGGAVFIGANWQTDGVDLAHRAAGLGDITIGATRTVNAGAGSVTMQIQAGAEAGSITTGSTITGSAISLISPNTVTVRGTLRAAGNPIDISGNTVLGASVTFDTTNSGTVPAGAAISLGGTLDSDATARTLTVTAGTGGNVTFNGSVGGTSALQDLTVNSANDLTMAGTSGTINAAVAFANTGVLSLGAPGGTLTFGGGVTATAPASSTLAGTIQSTNDVLRFGPVTLAGATTLVTNATTGTGDVFLGAVTGAGHALTLATGAGIVGADVTGTSVSGVSTLTLQDIGGTASFTGAVSPATLAVGNTVNAVRLTGTGSTITNAVTFGNTGALTLGSAGSTLTFAGGLTATAPLTRTVTGTIQTTDAPIVLGALTLGGDTTLATNATTAAATIALGAVTGSTDALTLSTGAGIAGADVTGTAVSGVSTLTLQDVGGTAAFTGAVSATTLVVDTTVNDVSLTGATGSITNPVTFDNTGALTLGTAGGTLTFGGGLTATAPATTTVAGTIQTTNDLLTFGAITLGAATTLRTQASTGAGDLTLGAVTGGGNALTLSTGSGVAGADVTATSVSGVSALALASIGGTAAFTGPVDVTTLTVPNTVRALSLTGSTGTIVNPVTFSNTTSLTLGSAGGTLTFEGGLTATAPSSRTLAGTIQSTDAAMSFGSLTLAAPTTLTTNATTAAGDLTLGAVTGAGNPLTLSTGAGIAGADVSGTSVSGVSTLALQNIGGTAAFTGAVSPTTLTADNTVNAVSLTGTTGSITSPVTFANTGALTLGAVGGTLTFTGGLTATAPASTTLAGTIQTGDAPLTLAAVTLGGTTILKTNATTAAADLTLGAVTATADALTLSTGVDVAGADVIGTTIAGVSTLTLQNIGGVASFSDVSATTLTVANTVNDVSLTGASGSITSAVTFANTGALTLGVAGGTLTFGGGLTATAPATRTLAGTIQTTSDVLSLGAATLAADTTLTTNAISTAGDITVGAISGGGHAFTLATGAGIAGANVTGTSVSGVSTFTLQDVGGTATFTGAVSPTTLNVGNTVNAVSLTGATGSITSPVTFGNTGALTLGSVGGTLTFAGGLTATAPSSRRLTGIIETTDAAIALGAVTLGGDTTLATNATTAAATLTLGTVTGSADALTLSTGAGIAGADVTGVGISGVSTLTLQDIGGTAAFTGTVSPTTLSVATTVNNVSLTGAAGSITSPVTFDNTGSLTLGSAGGTLTFTGGLTATAPASTTLAGTIRTTNTPITLGAVSLAGATTVQTRATSNAAADLTLGAVTGNGQTLTLSTGANAAGTDVLGTSVSGVSTLTLQNIAGTAAFTGAVDATTLTVASTVEGVSLTGTTGSITSPVTFANTSGLTLGSAGGTLAFPGGLTATAASSITLGGTITTGGAIDLTTAGAIAQSGNLTTAGGAVSLTAGGGGITMAPGTTTSTSGGAGTITYTAAGPITIASLSTGGDVVVDANGGSILAVQGGPNITAGGSLSLNALGGTIGTAIAPIAVAIAGPATMNATGILDGVSIAATGTVGSTLPIVLPTTVGAVLFNAVDLTAPVPPAPVVPVFTGVQVAPVLATANVPSLADLVGAAALIDATATIALLAGQNVAVATAALAFPLMEAPPSTAYAEVSTENGPSELPSGSVASAVVRPVAVERGAVLVIDGGMRLPAGLDALPVGRLSSPDAPSDSER